MTFDSQVLRLLSIYGTCIQAWLAHNGTPPKECRLLETSGIVVRRRHVDIVFCHERALDFPLTQMLHLSSDSDGDVDPKVK